KPSLVQKVSQFFSNGRKPRDVSSPLLPPINATDHMERLKQEVYHKRTVLNDLNRLAFTANADNTKNIFIVVLQQYFVWRDRH
ncbi:hypothetical protein ACC704_37450, partial [Rhizobium johnstonii]|uniref:hypothetical protein n=1 Tax=Rhizobium johnstonii TaxID=3019933 RepID=UPI003F95A3FA